MKEDSDDEESSESVKVTKRGRKQRALSSDYEE